MTQVLFYCPYCGEEDLRPAEEPDAAWRCADCQRVFVVTPVLAREVAQ